MAIGSPAMRFAAAAHGLIGARFRLHGRGSGGLDCVGLIEAALVASGRNVRLPLSYSLKMREAGDVEALAERLGFAAAQGAPVPGDVLLLKPGPCQFHFAIVGRDGGFVHAHAGLRRVVHAPALPAGEVCGHWRMR